MGPRKLASTCSPGRWWGRDPVTSRSRVTQCAYRWTYLYAVVPICSGPTLGVPPSTFPSAKARAWFHKFCWDVEWYPIAILRKEVSSSRSHDWPQSFHWVHKPRQGVDFWLFRRASLHDLSPSLSLEMFHHALWEKKNCFSQDFQGWLSSRWIHDWLLPLSYCLNFSEGSLESYSRFSPYSDSLNKPSDMAHYSSSLHVYNNRKCVN